MTVHYRDDRITLHCGDALEVAKTLPDESVDCICTSPPYFGLRDYGAEGQYGLEPTPDEYAKTLRGLFHELQRVLAADGTLWLNIGDSYGRGSRSMAHPPSHGLTGSSKNREELFRPQDKTTSLHLPSKSLLGIPWRVAFALQDDGWILRNDIVWAKGNGMPESVRDRLTCKHEHVFLFAKSQKYHFDLDPIRLPLAHPEAADGSRIFGGRNKAKALQTGSSARRTGRAYTRGKNSWTAGASPLHPQRDSGSGDQPGVGYHPNGKNPGDVWTINTQPFPEAHFATFPVELPRRCIAAGCKPEGVVLDPFSGSGTTGKAALELGRRYVGIDLSADYLDLSLRTRLNTPTLPGL